MPENLSILLTMMMGFGLGVLTGEDRFNKIIGLILFGLAVIIFIWNSFP